MKAARVALAFTLGLGVLVAPLATCAQPATKVPRIGFVIFTPELKDAFLQGLRDAGYVDGRNIIVEQRLGERPGVPYGKDVIELLESKVDVLVLTGSGALNAKKATSTVPVVAIDLYNDPIASGLVATYGRPGGNITGLFLDLPDLVGKHVQLLREAVPGLSRVGVLWDDRIGGPQFRALEVAARATGITVRPVAVHNENDLGSALDRVVKERPQALLGLGAPVISRNRKRIADVALAHRLPAITIYPSFPEVGGLIGYGPKLPDLWRRAASFVDRILKGTPPGDLPIERPAKYHLVINLRTAKALGLEIPPALLLQADHVIQ